MPKQKENNPYLRPFHGVLKIKGRLFYSESARAWNIIRLKRELLREFSQLKEKTGTFGYKMLFFRSYKEIKDKIKKLEEKEEALPILMFFYKASN